MILASIAQPFGCNSSDLSKKEEKLSEENLGLTKKELLNLTREREKLDRSLGGIREMGGLPDVVVVIDTNKEEIAVHEANKLNIPVIAVVDSNSNPEGVQYPIPGNDDATRSITTYCELVAQSILSGLQKELAASGVDVGANAEITEESLPELKEEEKAATTVGQLDPEKQPEPDVEKIETNDPSLSETEGT